MNIKILEAKDMLRTNEEKELLRKLADGSLDGLVGSPLITSGGSTIWSVIENGIPTRYKRGPGGKYLMDEKTRNLQELSIHLKNASLMTRSLHSCKNWAIL